MLHLSKKIDVIFLSFLSVWSMAVLADVMPDNDTQDTIYIGVQPRYFPYSHQSEKKIEGVLVTATREVCTLMNYTCIFTLIDFDESLQALRYRKLDAIIVAEHFIAEIDAEGLFFSPHFCKTKPVFIWGKRIEPVIDKNAFKGKQVGVLADSYLEFYLQNTLPLNVHIIPVSYTHLTLPTICSV